MQEKSGDGEHGPVGPPVLSGEPHGIESVIGTARKLANFLTREVGIGSRDEDFEGQSLMRATISGTVTRTKEDKGGSVSGRVAATSSIKHVNWPLNR